VVGEECGVGALLWSTANLENIHVVASYLEHRTGVRSTSVTGSLSKGLAMTAGASDRNARLWSLNRRGRSVSSLALFAHPAKVTSVSVSAVGDVGTTGCLDGCVRVWLFSNRQCIHTFTHSEGSPVTTVSLLGGALLSGSVDGTVKLWSLYGTIHEEDAEAGHVTTLTGLGTPVGAVAASSSLGVIASAANATLVVFRPASNLAREMAPRYVRA